MGRAIFFLASFGIFLFAVIYFSNNPFDKQGNSLSPLSSNETVAKNPYADFPLSIEFQRDKAYPGSDFVIEETLPNGINYKQYIASYKSDGLKIYGLLSVPTTPKPEGGYPAIIFNHGYIAPSEYRTTERYVAYFGTLASSGYVVFKPDYRGHGSSEGTPSGAYFSPDYLTDVLNALASVEKLEYVNTDKIGMWGHSLGGFLTLRSMVISNHIKAGVIWGGVVGSYQEMYEDWWSKRRFPSPTSAQINPTNRPSRQAFIAKYGQPTEDNEFWNAISSTTYINDVSGPIQLHHGLSDETVPDTLSKRLYERMANAGKEVEYFEYPGNDHNLSQSFSLAMDRTVEFFDKYLK